MSAADCAEPGNAIKQFVVYCLRLGFRETFFLDMRTDCTIDSVVRLVEEVFPK